MKSSASEPSKTILVVEDDMALQEALADTLELSGHSVVCAADGDSALDILGRKDIDMVVTDVQMQPMDGHTLLMRIKQQWPEMPVLIMTAYGTIHSAVDTMREGASDYLVKPFEASLLVNKVEQYLPSSAIDDSAVVAEDVRSQEIFDMARRVAVTDATVLIAGESGTGKEVLARFIHRNSPRVDKPFIAINCAAIPENMLEAMLFGYEKGAFTGAHQACAGKFELAQNGTLLLDEISEMDLALQAKLLRVLQEREVERLGGHKIIKLDVRVLATTNRNMRDLVATGKFREDLFYRLNVFPLQLPPLRQRKDDIIPLVQRMLSCGATVIQRLTPTLNDDAKSRLLAYTWPGNVRELDNVIQRALILQPGGIITGDNLQFEREVELDRFDESDYANVTAVGETLGQDLKSREQELILDALRTGNGSRKAAAEKLGISQRTLRYKLARMRDAGINIPRYASA